MIGSYWTVLISSGQEVLAGFVNTAMDIRIPYNRVNFLNI